jgi:hypothetical protein
MGKKIISYSLWGDIPMYTIGAIRNAELAKEIYPDWVCRFYVGDNVPSDIIEQLSSFDNTEIVVMVDEENDWQGMFWRFYAVDVNVDYVIFRDTDSRLNVREKVAVLEWINSGKCLHIMRDHPYHTEAIMGGMWGCKAKELICVINEKINTQTKLSNLKECINLWLKEENQRTHFKKEKFIKEEQYNMKGIDQIFLRSVIYKRLVDDAWIQDSFPQYNSFSGRFDFQYSFEMKEINTGFPFPRGKDWNNFIGQVYDENDTPNKEYAELLKQRDECIYMDWNKE